MGLGRFGLRGVAVILLLLGGCAKGDPLTGAAIDAAEARWRANPLAAYRMHLEISGDLIQEGEFVIEVRDGEVASVTGNGETITTRDDFYTVDGLFTMLRQELEMATQPHLFWQPPKDARIYQRAHFDAQTGYCRRYLRSVTGTQHNIVIKVTALEPL